MLRTGAGKAHRQVILSSGSHLREEFCQSESGLTTFPNTAVTKSCISGEKNNLHASWNIIISILDYYVRVTQINTLFREKVKECVCKDWDTNIL